MKLSGAVVIVLGASSGIGRATALAMARKGALLALAARNRAALEEVASEVERLGQTAMVCPTDVTCPEQVVSMVDRVLERWGRVDVLVASNGQYIRSPIRTVTLSLLEQSLKVNFYGVVSAVMAVLPHMLARRSGHIVLVSSMDARLALPLDAPYTAAKAALTGFGDTLRKELYGSGVAVTGVLPGRVDTPMIAGLKFHPISAKISAEVVARGIIRAVERGRSEVILPPQAWLLHFVNIFSPGLADWFVRAFRLEGQEV